MREIHKHEIECDTVASMPLGLVSAEECDSETEFADRFDTCVQEGSMDAAAGRACQTSRPPHLTRALQGKNNFTGMSL